MSVVDDYNSGRTQSIPTWWNTQLYRSGLEAHGAHFTHWWASGGIHAPETPNRSGIYRWNRVDYEPESFYLSDGSHYRPDFRVLSHGPRPGTREECGVSPIYVEMRGSHSKDAQIELFGQQCLTLGAQFLVLYPNELLFYCPSDEDLNIYTEDVFLTSCGYCRVPIVAAFTWVECKWPPALSNAFSHFHLKCVGDVWFYGVVRTHCHHCGECGGFGKVVNIRMCDGKIYLDTWLKTFVSLPNQSGREWLDSPAHSSGS
jgi:hypothetical protein